MITVVKEISGIFIEGIRDWRGYGYDIAIYQNKYDRTLHQFFITCSNGVMFTTGWRQINPAVCRQNAEGEINSLRLCGAISPHIPLF